MSDVEMQLARHTAITEVDRVWSETIQREGFALSEL